MAKNGSKEGNGNKEGIVELWGHEFNLVKNGLDEAQIASFVNELTGERDLLIQRLEHMSSLTKLAEKTIVEADRLAEEIRQESRSRAEAEANAIVTKAEEQAQQAADEKRTDLMTAATKEAEAIKANAEREIKLLLEHERERIQPEIRDTGQQLYRELLSQLESLKQQVTASEIEFERKLSQPVEEAGTATTEKEPASAPAPANMEEESDVISDTSSEVSLEDIEGAEGISAESQQPTQTIDQANMDEVGEEAPLSADTQGKPIYENEVELELLPPIDIKQILGIMRHLDGLTEIANTELIPLTDGPLIIVTMREPVQLIDILRTLPEVNEAKEITDHEGKRRKIQLKLSGNSVLDDAKERLNSEVYHSLSS